MLVCTTMSLYLDCPMMSLYMECVSFFLKENLLQHNKVVSITSSDWLLGSILVIFHEFPETKIYHVATWNLLSFFQLGIIIIKCSVTFNFATLKQDWKKKKNAKNTRNIFDFLLQFNLKAIFFFIISSSTIMIFIMFYNY